jgi:hypothetical protein
MRLANVRKPAVAIFERHDVVARSLALRRAEIGDVLDFIETNVGSSAQPSGFQVLS